MPSSAAPLQVVILAAGQGKRMHSDLPKVLHPLAGRPLLSHVIETARALAPRRLCVVLGHGASLVRERLADAKAQWALQEQQLGTGHAVLQALPSLDSGGTVLEFGRGAGRTFTIVDAAMNGRARGEREDGRGHAAEELAHEG